MNVTIDRFEGEYAVCEKHDGEMINLLRLKLPAEAKEGDVLFISGDDIHIDYSKTSARKNEIENMTKDLWK